MHKTRRGSTPVIVHTLDTHTTSPHVLALSQQTKQKESIPSFSEDAPTVRERRVVDFAQLVESHFETKRSMLDEEKKGTVSVQSPVHPVFTKESYRPADKKQVKRRSFIVRMPVISLPKVPTLRLPSYHPVAYITNVVHAMSGSLRGSITPVRMRGAVVVLCLCALLPFPAVGYYRSVRTDSVEIVSQSTNAFLSLQSSTVAALHTNIDQASVDLSAALESFASARQLVEEKHGALVSLVKLLPGIGGEVQTREAILVAGHNIAMGNTYLIKGIAQAQQTGELPLTDRITTFVYHVRAALPSYDAALVELAKVDITTLPVEHQETFIELRVLFGAFINDMHDTVALVDSLSEVLGGEGLRSYLIIGQNSHELRPTGGFMGSMALVSVQNGKIVRFEIPKGGTYDVQGQIQTSFKPPLPLQTINKRWELQDANWFPDFSVSAQKIISLYEESRRETVDGVIAVNAHVLERLLVVLGPVILEGTTVDDGTVIHTLSDSIKEKRVEKSTEPKAVLGDLVSELQVALTQSDATDIVQLLLTLSASLSEKDIQIYSTDNHIQAQIASFGWAGALQQTSPKQDYLAVNVSNIGGEKSDAFMEQHVGYDVAITQEGKAYGMVTITRSYMTDELSRDIYVPNIAYVRTYVPYGATLVSASGFDFPSEEMFTAPESWYQTDTLLDAVEKEVGFDDVTGTRITYEFGKTVFGNWMFVSPGEQKQVTLVYELPFSVFDVSTDDSSLSIAGLFGGQKKQSAGYSLAIQKQSGIQSPVDVSIIYPEGWVPAWRSLSDIVLVRNGATFSTELETDQTIGFVFERSRVK
jgi:hypothetical protein